MKKTSNVSIFMIMFGFTFFSGSMLAGQKIAAGLPYNKFLLAILIGGLLLGCFGGVLAYISSKTQSGFEELAVRTFGERGAYLASLLISITQIGWYGVGISMFAVPVSNMIKPGNKAILFVIIAVFGILMTLSTSIGIKAITRLSFIAVPVIFVFGIGIISYAITSKGITLAEEFGKGDNIDLLMGMEMVVGTFISGSITTPNFTYNGKKPFTVACISFFAFFVGNILMFFLGAVSYIIVGQADIFNLFLYYNCPILGILVLGLNIWSTNDNGLYSSGLGLQRMTKINYRKIVIFTGVFSTFFSLALYEHFSTFLTVLNRTLPPIGVVIIIDYFIGEINTKSINWIKVAAVLLGIAIGFYSKRGIPIINEMLMTALVCLIGDTVKKARHKNGVS